MWYEDKMKHQILYTYLIILFSMLLSSCSQGEHGHQFCIQGAWKLESVIFYQDDTVRYPVDGMTWMRVYDDSCFYECRFSESDMGFMIIPTEVVDYTLVKNGPEQYLYLQNGNTNPLSVVDDTTMVIQQTGRQYRWVQYDDLLTRRRDDIVRIIREDLRSGSNTHRSYVVSEAEKQLTTTNHTLIYVIIGIAVAFILSANYLYRLRREKKRVEQEIHRIRQEQQLMPAPVRQALIDVEDEFHQSDFYVSLHKRIAHGEHLKKEDWDSIEQRLNRVYPGFTNKLLSLYNMSDVELHVCLLLKLNASPSEIAGVLCKDTSSISSIRSRLFYKVFDKKGSSKEWDEFIHTL